VSDLSLTPGDPTRTIHFRVGHLLARLWEIDGPGSGSETSELAAMLEQSSLDARKNALLHIIGLAWLGLGVVFVGLIVVIAIPLDVLVGHSVGDPVSLAFLGGCFFCIGGVINVLWRTYWYVPRARRVAHAGDNEAPAYAAAMRRTLPRNSSVVFQAAFAVAGILMVLGSGG
jgi:hypothetical protein